MNFGLPLGNQLYYQSYITTNYIPNQNTNYGNNLSTSLEYHITSYPNKAEYIYTIKRTSTSPKYVASPIYKTTDYITFDNISYIPYINYNVTPSTNANYKTYELIPSSPYYQTQAKVASLVNPTQFQPPYSFIKQVPQLNLM